MTLDFDLEETEHIEFGLGRDDGDAQAFLLVPVDADVQAALREMADATWNAMQAFTDAPPSYDPSEKHAAAEYVHLTLGDLLATRMRELHEAVNMPLDANALSDTTTVFCYFARMTDTTGRHLTALRRASTFKGVLKSRLIRVVTDSLQLIEDRVFRLDNDFDLLIDSDAVHVLRPSGFEFVGNLREAILKAVPTNVASIQKDLPFVDLSGIEAYASKHPRAARYLASIRGQAETENIDEQALINLCDVTGVTVQLEDGKLTVDGGHEMGFLEVLDRRRYELTLVTGAPERFKAASRSKIEN